MVERNSGDNFKSFLESKMRRNFGEVEKGRGIAKQNKKVLDFRLRLGCG